MTHYLDLDTALAIAARAVEAEPQVADYGLQRPDLGAQRPAGGRGLNLAWSE